MNQPPFEYKSIVHSSGGKQTFCGIKDAVVLSPQGTERHVYLFAEFPVDNVFFHTLLDDLFEYFHQGIEQANKSGSIEETLESGLRSINGKFTEFAQSIDPAQLPSIRALITVVEGNNVHLSPVGNVHAYYCTQQRVMDVLGDRPVEPDINPDALFSQIISGEFIPGSAMVLCTDRMIEIFSPERIKRTIMEKSVDDAAEMFSELVTEDPNHPSIVATFIKPDSEHLEVIREKQRTAAGPSPDEDSMAELVSKEENTKALLSPGFLNSVKRLGGNFKNLGKTLPPKFAGRFSRKKKEDGAIDVKGPEKASQKITVNDADKELDESIPELIQHEDTSDIASLSKTDKPKRFSKLTAVFAKSTKATKGVLTKVSKEARGTVKKGKISGFKGSLIQGTAKIVVFISNLSWPRRILLILAFLLVFLFAQSVIFEGRLSANSEQNQEYTRSVDQAEVKINEAKAALLYNNEEDARKSLSEAKSLLLQIPEDHKLYESEVAPRLLTINEQERVLNKEEEVLPISTTPLPEEVSNLSLAYFSDVLYGASLSNGKVYKLDNGQWVEIVDAESTWRNFHPSENRLIGVLEDGSLKELKDGALADITYEKPENADIADIAFFNSNLYLLDKGNKQIYKLTPGTGSYVGPTAWITDETVGLGSPKSLFIDGSIYVLSEDGSFSKWFDGSQQRSFTTGTEPEAGFTDFIAGENELYLLSSSRNRIVITQKEGGLVKQLTSESFNGSASVAINGDASTMFISTDHGMETISQ